MKECLPRIAVAIGLLLILLLITFKAEAIERDKITHASVSLAGQAICAAVATEIIEDKTTANVACFAAVMAAGLAVELDMVGANDFDTKDLIANTAGATLGALIVEWKF